MAALFLKDELPRLKLLYKNFKDICPIVVLDGGSSDGSKEFCSEKGIKFISRPKAETWHERVNLINWCMDQINTDYVLIVYAAHFYPKPLLDVYGKVSDENRLHAVFNDVVIYRYGEVIHRPFIRRIASVCNFFKKETLKLNEIKIHDEFHIDFDPNCMTRLDEVDNLSLHLFQDEDSLSFTKKTLNYIEIEAEQKFKDGIRVSFMTLLFQPFFSSIYSYIRTGSILYGSKGLVYTYLNFVYDLILKIRIWELNNSIQKPKASKLNFIAREKLFNFFEDN